MASKPRVFAVIPAAGRSRRMGRPKLLIDIRGMTVIERLLNVLRNTSVDAVVVVTRPDDVDLQLEIERIKTRHHSSLECLIPNTAPADMRVSVELALRDLATRFSPSEDDGWLLIPADHPVVTHNVLTKAIDVWHQSAAPIVVPTRRHRRGHPTIFRWSLAKEVATIPKDSGLNWLVRKYSTMVDEFDGGDDSVLFDLDTPEDLARLDEWEFPPDAAS